jgi:hypothetical protein
MNDILVRSEERKYFTLIPNMIDDLHLTVYAFRLYCHIKRVVGEFEDGSCWQSTRTLATHCNMSLASISKAKKELEKAGLIRIESKPGDHGDYHEITIRDVWARNMAQFSESSKRSPDERMSTPDERMSTPDERKRSPGEIKEEPLKKNHPKKTIEKEDENSGGSSTTFQPPLAVGIKEKQPKPTFHDKIVDEILLQGREPDHAAIDEAIAMWYRESKERDWKPTNIDGILERYDIITNPGGPRFVDLPTSIYDR